MSKTFTVEQLHCGACEAAIRKSLSRLDGVRQVVSDPATNQVTVTFDDAQVDAETVATRLGDAGYPVVA